jgi:hypothetical protein
MQIDFPVDYVHMPNGCVAVWRAKSGSRKKAGPCLVGRPAILFEGEAWKVARLSYHLNVASLPKTPETLKEGITCHHCDNAWCINPKHIYLGTAKQNTADIFVRNKFVRRRMSKAQRGNQRAKGNKLSIKTRQHISQMLRGNQNAKGNSFTLTSKQLRRRRWPTKRKREWAKRMRNNTFRRDFFNRQNQSGDAATALE